MRTRPPLLHAQPCYVCGTTDAFCLTLSAACCRRCEQLAGTTHSRQQRTDGTWTRLEISERADRP